MAGDAKGILYAMELTEVKDGAPVRSTQLSGHEGHPPAPHDSILAQSVAM